MNQKLSSPVNVQSTEPENFVSNKSGKRKKRNKKNVTAPKPASDEPRNCENNGQKQQVSAEELEITLYHLFVEEMKSIEPFISVDCIGSSYPNWTYSDRRFQFTGFVNAQNKCYLIVCLQTLFHIPALLTIFERLSVGIHKFFSENGSLVTVWSESLTTSTPMLRLMLLLLDELSGYSLNSQCNRSPSEFGLILTPAKPIKFDPAFIQILGFEPDIEQDAADCMNRMLTQLHEEMAYIINKYKNPKLENLFLDSIPSDEDGEWTTIGSKGTKFSEAREMKVDNGEASPISLLFAGFLVSRSSYNKISFHSDKSSIGTKERFFVLPLEINNPTVKRIEDCFGRLSQAEKFSDFRDPESGNCVVMSRKVVVDHLPPVLFLQLNRFFYTSTVDKHGNKQFGIQKVLKEIPICRRLQIVEDVVSKEHKFSRNQGAYQLHSIVFHIGYKATRGHYTSAVWQLTDQQQQQSTPGVFYVDDERVFYLPTSGKADVTQAMLNTQKSFDANTCRFKAPKPESSAVGEIAPNISEQPRSPYLLVYTSLFSK